MKMHVCAKILYTCLYMFDYCTVLNYDKRQIPRRNVSRWVSIHLKARAFRRSSFVR